MTNRNENLDYDQYYNPQVLLDSIKTKTGMKLEELTTFITETQIILKGEEIKNYLDNKYQIDYPNGIVSNPMENEFEEASNRFIGALTKVQYEYNSYPLFYFNNMLSILKKKTGTFLCIVKIISTKDNDEILKEKAVADLFELLDINLDLENKVSGEDIYRLSTVITNNYKKIVDISTRGNKVETYFGNSMSREYFAMAGISEEEVYPPKDLQIQDVFQNSMSCLPLSRKQTRVIQQQDEEQMKLYFARM